MDQLIVSTSGYTILLTDSAGDDDRHFLRDRIRAFNDANSPHHMAVRSQGAVPLDLFVRDPGGKILGGLTASTYWGWLEIEYLWLEERLRRQELGSQLVLAAEAEAVRRGCASVFLSTFSFQARGFYEKLGYRVTGQLDDYPPGSTFYWLRKDLGRGFLREKAQ